MTVTIGSDQQWQWQWHSPVALVGWGLLFSRNSLLRIDSALKMSPRFSSMLPAYEKKN